MRRQPDLLTSGGDLPQQPLPTPGTSFCTVGAVGRARRMVSCLNGITCRGKQTFLPRNDPRPTTRRPVPPQNVDPWSLHQAHMVSSSKRAEARPCVPQSVLNGLEGFRSEGRKVDKLQVRTCASRPSRRSQLSPPLANVGWSHNGTRDKMGAADDQRVRTISEEPAHQRAGRRKRNGHLRPSPSRDMAIITAPVSLR